MQHIAVLVPARNEEHLLPRCLESIIAASRVLPTSITCDIIVCVDRSTDRTREIASSMLARYGAVTYQNDGIVGLARSRAAALALERYCGPADLCWLANTDADCIVPRTWLLQQASLAATAAHAVAGIIEVDSFVEHRPGVDVLYRASYKICWDGTHPHVHGANLGVRADAYLAIGGWGSLTTAEDHDLWNRLAHKGFTRLSVSGLRVITSGRRIGRAPNGFARALALHDEVLT